MTGAGNWTWLLTGATPTLIDAGTGESEHLSALDRALDGRELRQVLVTHGHTDHASGAPGLRARFPGAIFGKMPWPERDERWPAAWQPLADGDIVPAGDTSLQVIHTPGHAPDHVCFWHEESRTLFGGDLALRSTSVSIQASLRGDAAAYLASLEYAVALRPARIFPAHGPVIDDPQRLLRQCIAHRHEREQQVLAALQAGDRLPAEIVRRVYRGLQERLLPLAEEGVVAYLVKLEREGRVRRRDDRWEL